MSPTLCRALLRGGFDPDFVAPVFIGFVNTLAATALSCRPTTFDERYDVKTDRWRSPSARDTGGRQGRIHGTDVSLPDIRADGT